MRFPSCRIQLVSIFFILMKSSISFAKKFTGNAVKYLTGIFHLAKAIATLSSDPPKKTGTLLFIQPVFRAGEYLSSNSPKQNILSIFIFVSHGGSFNVSRFTFNVFILK